MCKNDTVKREAHNCHFCGDFVLDGYTTVTEKLDVRDYAGDRGVPGSANIKLGTRWNSYKERHWLSDCRPDLVEHEPGPLCTWANCEHNAPGNCYAFQDRDTNKWGNEHKHFYSDGPM